MGESGIGRFVNRRIVKQNDTLFSFEVRNCFFNRFFQEVNTPELTKLFCEVDNNFFAKTFPNLKFHRGSSFENTIAYGKDHCKFIFELNRSDNLS